MLADLPYASGDTHDAMEYEYMLNLNVYRNGRELVSKGIIETYDTLPETALVKMM